MADTLVTPTIIRTARGLSIAGTRLTLYDVLPYIAADWPPTLIQHWFNLSETQMYDILSYLALYRQEVEAEYHQILQQAQAHRRYWEARNGERLAQTAHLPPRPGYEAAIAKLRTYKAQHPTS